jgi:hypothetical protein
MVEARAHSRPLPRSEGLAGEFYAHCREGRLCFQRCEACQAWRHLPRLQCPRCGSTDWEWRPSSGRGRILSWTVTHEAPLPAFAARTPYAVVVVELEEGVRMVSGVRELAPAELALDLPVEVVFEQAGNEVTLPFFRPRR